MDKTLYLGRYSIGITDLLIDFTFLPKIIVPTTIEAINLKRYSVKRYFSISWFGYNINFMEYD